ncbi:hypothetical protein AB0O87_01570 [Microbacterium sp. NPDC076768]|uniref:hypothetical protein n=1 Tax=Microbacterium sp. NPDC076768 TaxID=3154858 RepID=UPI00343702E7
MNHPVENANPRRRRTTLASPLVAALTLLLVLLGAQSATAQDQSATSQASQPAISTQPLATASTTPTPSPTPSEAEKTDHQQQNGEEDVERTDLSLLGFAFVGAIGFLLAAGALGVFLSARAKRSRDRRSTTHSEEASDEA